MLSGYSQAHLRFSVSVLVCHCVWVKKKTKTHGLFSLALPARVAGLVMFMLLAVSMTCL